MAYQIDQDQIIIVFPEISSDTCDLTWCTNKKDFFPFAQLCFEVTINRSHIALYIFGTFQPFRLRQSAAGCVDQFQTITEYSSINNPALLYGITRKLIGNAS